MPPLRPVVHNRSVVEVAIGAKTVCVLKYVVIRDVAVAAELAARARLSRLPMNVLGRL